MSILRIAMVWILVLCLPVEGMAANLMTHCKDMQKMGAMPAGHSMSQHDHAAMMQMAAMSDDGAMASMHHHPAMSAKAEKSKGKILKLGCQCGCQCGGDCAVSCAGMMVSLPDAGFDLGARAASILTAMPRVQAHAAYRYEPLRPPSAVAL